MVVFFQNSMGMSWKEIKTYRKKIATVRYSPPKIAKDVHALLGMKLIFLKNNVEYFSLSYVITVNQTNRFYIV